MELLPMLTRVCATMEEDARLGPAHVSLYLSLLQEWNVIGGVNPISIQRKKVMKLSKIKARRTYNKCINQLCEYGYIQYKPSVNSHTTSVVHLNTI